MILLFPILVVAVSGQSAPGYFNASITTVNDSNGAVDSESVVSVKRVSCALTPNDRRDCDTCIAKGPDCFWCNENSACLSYEWYFPGCGLTEVKYQTCWVNWSAIAIVLAILAGILIVILFVCVCCCCCRIRAANRRRRQKAGERREAKLELAQQEMTAAQEERRAKREEEMKVFREKYGIPKKSDSDVKKF